MTVFDLPPYSYLSLLIKCIVGENWIFSENEVHLVSQIPIIHLSICIVLILFWNIASH